MSTLIKTIEDSGTNGVPLTVTRFYGGDKGVCAVLSAKMDNGDMAHIELTVMDMIKLEYVFKQVGRMEVDRIKRDREDILSNM